MAMQAVRVRQKGQITLPAEIRSELGIEEGDKLLVERRGKEIVFISAEDAADPLAGVFQEYVKVWNPDVNEEKTRIRQSMAEAAARKHL